MRNIFTLFTVVFLSTNYLFAIENLAPESVEVAKKIITINQEAMRAPASVDESATAAAEEETLTDAMEKVEEPKLWFNP